MSYRLPSFVKAQLKTKLSLIVFIWSERGILEWHVIIFAKCQTYSPYLESSELDLIERLL